MVAESACSCTRWVRVAEEPADVGAVAVAMAGDFEPVLDGLCPRDQGLDARELLVGECAVVAAGITVGAVGSGEDADLVEAEPCALGDIDDREAVQDVFSGSGGRGALEFKLG